MLHQLQCFENIKKKILSSKIFGNRPKFRGLSFTVPRSRGNYKLVNNGLFICTALSQLSVSFSFLVPSDGMRPPGCSARRAVAALHWLGNPRASANHSRADRRRTSFVLQTVLQKSISINLCFHCIAKLIRIYIVLIRANSL